MWIMEQPLVIVATGVILAGLFILGLVQTGRRFCLYGAIGVVVVTLGGLALERLVVTPKEEVRDVLNEIAVDLERNDVDAVMAHISPALKELKHDARSKMGMVEILDVDIKPNLKVDVVEHRGMRIATAKFNVTFRLKLLGRFGESLGGGGDRPYPQRFEIRFRNENGRWLVRDYEMKDPRGGIGT